jgi:hypothetical protein
MVSISMCVAGRVCVSASFTAPVTAGRDAHDVYRGQGTSSVVVNGGVGGG